MMLSEKFTLIVWLISAHLTSFVISIECDLEPKNNDAKLKKSLFCKYDKSVHPSLSNDPITIALKMVLKGFSFDDHEQVLIISSWLSMQWKDDNLKWTPAEFGGLSDIVVLSEDIWQPDLQLFNSDIASVQADSCKSARCVVASTGQVSCIPPCIHTARCFAEFSDWPFDTQNCSLHIGTWINAADEVDFRVTKTVIPEADLQSQNKLWKMLKVTYMRNHGNFSSIKKRYPSVLFTFLLERHSSEHAAAFFVPAMIMASINLISLWMSPALSQRLLLVAFNILAHFIFMQQLSWFLPSNGDICPTIVLCFRDSLIITGFLLINTIVVRGFTSCGLEVPLWVGSTTGFMGSNKFGQIFLSKSYLIDRQPLHSENSEDAADVNVSEPPTVTIKPPTNTWVLFAKFIDRLLFIIVLVLYVFMYFLLMPKGYMYGQPRGDIEIIGY